MLYLIWKEILNVVKLPVNEENYVKILCSVFFSKNIIQKGGEKMNNQKFWKSVFRIVGEFHRVSILLKGLSYLFNEWIG